MIQISKYKGYTIKYKEGKFFAVKGKGKKRMFEEDKEYNIRLQIDCKINEEKNMIDQKKKDAANKKLKEKEAKEKHKIWLEKRKGFNKKITFNAKDFKEFFQGVSLFCSECKLKFENKTMSTLIMDPANVAMIKRTLTYKGNIKIFEALVNTNNIKTLLTKAMGAGFWSNAKELTVKFDINEADEIYMYISNSFGEFKLLTCKDDYEKDMKYPGLMHRATFKMSRCDFYKYIEMADTIAESVFFEVKDKMLSISCKNEHQNWIKKDILKVKGKNVDCKSKYSVEYLKKRYFKLGSDELTIQISQDYPIVIKDDKDNVIILAPRVDND